MGSTGARTKRTRAVRGLRASDLTELKRPEAAARLAQALQFAGDLSDNPEYFDARAELDLLE